MRDAGVTTVNVTPVAGDRAGKIELIGKIKDLVAGL
jgi:hypothetical protein